MNAAHCTFKLDQTAYFYLQLIAELELNDLTFRYNLSAFLSSARSVIQYVHEAAKQAGRSAWYNTRVSHYPTFAFFKQERDTDIHRAPSDPAYMISIAVTSEFIESLRSAGANIRETKLETMPSGIHYYFGDDESNDVASLCERYLQDLRQFLTEATTEGILASNDSC